MYFAFTRMPGDRYYSRFRRLLLCTLVYVLRLPSAIDSLCLYLPIAISPVSQCCPHTRDQFSAYLLFLWLLEHAIGVDGHSLLGTFSLVVGTAWTVFCRCWGRSTSLPVRENLSASSFVLDFTVGWDPVQYCSLFTSGRHQK